MYFKSTGRLSPYIAGVNDAKVLACDPRADLADLYKRSEALRRAATHELGVIRSQQLKEYHSGACRALAYEMQRRKHSSPESLVRWQGGDVPDLQDPRDEMRRAAFPGRELPAATV